MIPEALASLAAIASVGEKLASSSDTVERQKLLLEFLKGQNHAQQVISGLLAEKTALAADRDKLEQELLRLKDWNAERDQYAPREVATGVFCQVRKGEEGPGQSLLKYCASCFEQGKKSILQTENTEQYLRKQMTCFTCKAKVTFDSFIDPPPA